jgi:peptide/nickel transport system substrate-binding protein
MQRKLFNLVIALTLLLALIPSVAVAAPQGQEETVYTVQKDDSLWAIAEKYLGSGATYGAIVVATNARHETDPSFARIDNPSLIQPGWKILVPGAEEAARLVEEWAAEAPTVGGELIVGLDHEPSGMDPHADLYETIPTIVWGVYNTLIYRVPGGSYVPGLATSWEASADGLSYTFHLRQGVKFHDGTPFNAQAVKFSLDRIVNPDTKSRWAAGLLGPYDSSEVIDDYTIKINMKDPYAPLFDSLSQAWLAIVSPTAVEKWGSDYRLHQVGTGPFRFVEYIEKDHVTLERNPDYNWAPPHFKHQGPAYLERIVFKIIPEAGTRMGTVETGETHLVNEVPPADVTRYEADPSFEVYNVPLPGMPRGFFVNMAKEPTDDLRVRQALEYALNREEIVKTLYASVYQPAYGPMEAATNFYDKSLESMYPYDPAKAQELLEEAGWKMGSDGIRQKNGQLLKLVVLFWEKPELFELVQAQLKKVGIDAELQQMAPLAYIQASDAGEHNLSTIGGRRPLDPKWMTGFFKSGEKYAWSKHTNTHLDELLKEGERTLDPEKRRQIYAEIQQIIMGEAMFLPVHSQPDIFVARNEVKGLSFDVRGDPNFYDVYLQQ